jgi:hypothetical protein
MGSDPGFSKDDPNADEHFERWEFERLAEAARGGSLAAGQELIRRAVIRLESTCSQRPDLIGPHLGDWLRRLLDDASKNPRQSIGQLIAPRSSRKRPKSHAELLHDLALMQEAYFRVRKAVDAGEPLKNVFDAVAEELNRLGYRNSNNRPLKGSSIRDRYYEVSRKKPRMGRDRRQDT